MKYSNNSDFLKIYLYAEQESNNSAVNYISNEVLIKSSIRYFSIDIFSSTEPKAQVSSSDHNLSVVEVDGFFFF